MQMVSWAIHFIFLGQSNKDIHCYLVCYSVDVLGYILNNIKFAIMICFLNMNMVKVDQSFVDIMMLFLEGFA